MPGKGNVQFDFTNDRKDDSLVAETTESIVKPFKWNTISINILMNIEVQFFC